MSIMLISYNVAEVYWSCYKGDSILADSGTEQLEFIALSQRTGDPKYQQKVNIFVLKLFGIFFKIPDGRLIMWIILND